MFPWHFELLFLASARILVIGAESKSIASIRDARFMYIIACVVVLQLRQSQTGVFKGIDEIFLA